MNKKFFFFDIDGTLAVGTPGRQYIPESTKKAIRLLKEQGHFVAIATGRSYAMAVDHMRSLGFENMVSDGGNGITINNELITIKPLDYQNIAGIGFTAQINDFTHDVYMDTEVVEGLDPRNYDQIFKVYVACFAPEEQKLETLKELPWCRFHKEYLFVEPGDKSVGIKMMVDHFKGDYKDVVVFGDEKNDLSMFRDEWTSIAMGNAIDELKEKATYVTTPCDQDGIYNACVHFGWIQE